MNLHSVRLNQVRLAPHGRRLKRNICGWLLLPAMVAALTEPARAQLPTLAPVSPFDTIGFMQTATVDNPTDTFSGGTMEVNGLKIIVPRNTIFQMPAAGMTWQELFKNAPAAYQAAHQTGMALTDTPKPYATYEVTVV